MSPPFILSDPNTPKVLPTVTPGNRGEEFFSKNLSQLSLTKITEFPQHEPELNPEVRVAKLPTCILIISRSYYSHANRIIYRHSNKIMLTVTCGLHTAMVRLPDLHEHCYSYSGQAHHHQQGRDRTIRLPDIAQLGPVNAPDIRE